MIRRRALLGMAGLGAAVAAGRPVAAQAAANEYSERVSSIAALGLGKGEGASLSVVWLPGKDPQVPFRLVNLVIFDLAGESGHQQTAAARAVHRRERRLHSAQGRRPSIRLWVRVRRRAVRRHFRHIRGLRRELGADEAGDSSFHSLTRSRSVTIEAAHSRFDVAPITPDATLGLDSAARRAAQERASRQPQRA